MWKCSTIYRTGSKIITFLIYTDGIDSTVYGKLLLQRKRTRGWNWQRVDGIYLVVWVASKEAASFLQIWRQATRRQRTALSAAYRIVRVNDMQ